MATIDIERDAARDAAAAELAKAIYPRPSLSDRLAEWLNDLLYRLMLQASSVPGGWLTLTVTALLVLAALIVAVRVARRTMGSGGAAPLYGERTLSASDHRSHAEHLAADAKWGPAIRQRLRAVGRQLEEDGLLNPVAGRTAGELARDGGARLGGLRAEFAAAAAVFDDVTYGGRAGTEAGYRLVSGLDDHLCRAIPATGSAAESGGPDWAAVR